MSERDPEGQVTSEVRGKLLIMTIDRPEKYNGLTPKMFTELSAAYTELEENDDIWVGVLTANGPHFTAGLDLPKFRALMKEGTRASEQGSVDIYGLRGKCTKPLVCAVQGITYTAGIEMMLGCDIVVAATDCRFSQLEPKRGIMATGGATIRFVERGGWGNAMYHLLTSDEFDANEAYRIGLVQELVEPGTQIERAIMLAEEIAKGAPLAVRATKASSMKYIEEGEAAAVAEFAKVQLGLADTQDAEEGVRSFVERRDGNFVGK